MNFRKNYDVIPKLPVKEFGPGRTMQEFKDDCDINTIMKRYINTGVLPQMIRNNPRYGDFSNVTSYRESIDLVRKAEEQFMALPAKVRKYFKNDAGAFLEEMNKTGNEKLLEELELIPVKKAVEEVKSQIVKENVVK